MHKQTTTVMSHKDNPDTAPVSAIEVWGGAEYTRNRVLDHYFDQMDLSGHAQRERDIAAFADLGIRALRCGVLWERHERDLSWAWSDAYLSAVRASGMRPVAGLLHHGSGPPSTSLVDPGFPEKLASYAEKVAQRYPWIDAYTPVNEPHTTARFACRYGIWYPHHRSEHSFLTALLNQVKGVALSMQAIRKVRPDAKLVQTDDLGGVWSTNVLASTCERMNERRWLPFDLLAGLVDRHHPLYEDFAHAGIEEEKVRWFLDHPCAPDVIGVNYYITSDRFLDDRIHLYPSSMRSAEGRFVDLEAVRVLPQGIQGLEAVLHEAHQRYHIPIAVTEVHLGDRVDEQIRWAAEAWHAAQRAKAAGVVCEGFTFWALLGSYFWNGLVTRDNGYYEPGVFDLQSGMPRPTALAEIVKQCSLGTLHHPALEQSGWWHRPERIQYWPDAELVA